MYALHTIPVAPAVDRSHVGVNEPVETRNSWPRPEFDPPLLVNPVPGVSAPPLQEASPAHVTQSADEEMAVEHDTGLVEPVPVQIVPSWDGALPVFVACEHTM